MDQRKLADTLARRVYPEAYAMDRWLVSPEYVRAVYGDEATDGYVMDFDYEMFLKREGRFGEYILNEAGCFPPYETSVPEMFPWLSVSGLEPFDKLGPKKTGGV